MEALIEYWQPALMAVLMMAMDMLTGFAGALKAGEVMSGKMREGLWHKMGFFGLVALAILYEQAAAVINAAVDAAGVAAVAMPELPAVAAVCGIVAAIEVVSILENLTALNPAIGRLPFVNRLKSHDPAAADGKKGPIHAAADEDVGWGYSPMYDGDDEMEAE